ncbi:hypothetical protein JMN32_05120 [Fulvivirga sp. 29W222]|uniref:Uncharacterized protein n=1 Tax=Fulvivirga marina TaxID=2494733 RepID=A0A937FVD4_9BACT|nr:hypothetical protein [Fulvivirga marina]MBL6445678.1 hypothetical protein [Fulvivirga marina]
MEIDIKKFYFQDSLYSKTEISDDDLESLFRTVYFSGKIDSYCPYCKKETVFQGEPIRAKKKNPDLNSYNSEIFSFEDFTNEYDFDFLRNKDFRLSFKCLREEYSHRIYFYVRVEPDSIFKIGQNPSLAELTDSFVTRKYKKLLSNDKISEFNKAIGLHAHGVGIGSFVYLRRIFEGLIFETFDKVQENLGISKEKFRSARMSDKITFLKDYLPEYLIENKEIYGILSKGIHELDENFCKEVFPVIQDGLEFILEEKLIQLEKENRKKSNSQLIQKIKQDLNNGK